MTHFGWLCQAGFMRLFFFFFSLMAPVGSILRFRDLSLVGALSLHRPPFVSEVIEVDLTVLDDKNKITLPSTVVRGMVGLSV